MPIVTRVKQAWSAFFSGGQIAPDNYSGDYGPSTTTRPDKPRLMFFNDRSLVSSIYTRIAIDVAGVNIRHVELDGEDRYSADVDSFLNKCLSFEPNIDQGPRAFRQDIVLTLFDKGVAAIVPVETTENPSVNEEFDVMSLRVGHICQWYPRHVKVSVYNDKTGQRQEIILEKRFVSIIENPLYAVMNEPNSTLQRLIRKLTLLDAVDEQSSSGKLDLIIQLPYVIKSDARRQQAEQRRQDIEFQLKGSQYGIAYTDGTEKITQLNRPAENNLLKQVEYLTNMLYGQLGITAEIMNGTADEKAMLHYFNRTVEPILDAIIEAMQRALLGPKKTGKKERIKYFRDPFKFVQVSDLAEIADKFTRNEIFTANEIRQFMGVKPSNDPKADKLMNSNMPQPTDPAQAALPAGTSDETFNQVNDLVTQSFDRIKSQVDDMTKGLVDG